MEGTYEYECMRAELLGKEKPSREVFEVEQAKLRQQIESEELLVEETKVSFPLICMPFVYKTIFLLN